MANFPDGCFDTTGSDDAGSRLKGPGILSSAWPGLRLDKIAELFRNCRGVSVGGGTRKVSIRALIGRQFDEEFTHRLGSRSRGPPLELFENLLRDRVEDTVEVVLASLLKKFGALGGEQAARIVLVS